MGPTPSEERGRLSLLCAFVVLLLGIWSSTGTLSIYAATLDPAVVKVDPACGYLLNIDHPHHRAPFLMLEGAPRESWEFSVVLRRILYPLIALPFVKMFGFEAGGLACNLLLQIAAWVGFVAYLRNRCGMEAAKAAGWLLATYPGVAYWVGSPYSYAIIVPASLAAFIALSELVEEQRSGRAFGIALLAGVLFTGYDLLVFFGPAAVIALASKRRFRLLLVTLLGFLIPAAVVHLVLAVFYRVPAVNPNTEVYAVILRSYLNAAPTRAWLRLLLEMPKVLAWDFLFANFLFLPLLFVALVAVARIRGGPELSLAERSFFAATLFVFLLNNLAPPYPGWQMRGTWIARLYQPVFVSFLAYCARFAQWSSGQTAPVRRVTRSLFGIALLANALIVFGPILPVRPASWLADRVYSAFYAHSPPGSLLANVERHGRRPIGFCRAPGGR